MTALSQQLPLPLMLEFETIVGKVKNEDDLIEKAKNLLNELDLEAACG